MAIINKKCVGCNDDLVGVNHQTRYCDLCKEKNNKNSSKKYKKRTRKIISNTKEQVLINNFSIVVSESFHLTPSGFNEVSNLSNHAYQNFYKKPWIEILKMFGKYEELVGYVLKEYKIFIENTNNMSFRYFTDNHKYIGIQILKTIGFQNIREMLGMKMNRNTKEDCENEFFRLVKMYNRVPLYSEFLDSSKITLKSYKYNFNLDDSKNIYDSIVRYCVDEELYQQYLTNRYEHKVKVGRENHQGCKYSDEALKTNLVNIFDEYYSKYDSYPSRRIFNEISPIDNSVYLHRFNKTWKEICRNYGYEIKGKLNKSENLALGIVREILNEEYESQKTFDWLIGFKKFPLFCDGYFPKHKLVVEFDGDQHRYPNEWFGGMETFNDTKTNDKYKDVLIPRNGLRIIRISSEEPFWDEQYIKNKLIEKGIIKTNNAI